MKSLYVLLVLFVAATATKLPAFDAEAKALCDLSHKDELNPIARENCKQGSNATEWDVNGAGDPTIQGFSTDISYNNDGQDVAKFKIKTHSTKYRVDVFRLGYYQGLGARHVATVRPHVDLPQMQPACHRDESTMLYDCGNWEVSVEWTVPAGTTSGVFIARLVSEDEPNLEYGEKPLTWRADNSPAGEDPRFAMPGGESMVRPKRQPHAYGANGQGNLRNKLKEPRASLVYFVIRCDSCRADIVFQTADTVWQAYNAEGGASTYGSMDPANPGPRCYKASYNRPLKTRQHRQVNSYFGSEYPISRFLESKGYDVTYVTGVDVDRFGQHVLAPKRKVFMSPGHDEYWSGAQRQHIVDARDKDGMHLVFLSGNEMYWRIRWEDNHRTMVVYKESQSLTKIDPKLDEWTGSFRDSRDINPLGAQPENAVTGTIFTFNAWRNDPLVIPYEFAQLRQWRHTRDVQDSVEPGGEAVLFRGVLGHEMDEDIDNGFRPAGSIRLSETRIDNSMYVQDFGSTFDSGSGTHHLVMYRNQESGAIVFGAGTVQWGWALDGFHDSEHQVPAHIMNHLNIRIGLDILAPCVAIQQFTLNILADMGAQPQTLLPSLPLVKASPTTDSTPPRCTVLGYTFLFENEGRNSANAPTLVVVAAANDEANANGQKGVVSAVEIRVRANDNNPVNVKRSRWYHAPRAKTNTSGGDWADLPIYYTQQHLEDVYLRRTSDASSSFYATAQGQDRQEDISSRQLFVFVGNPAEETADLMGNNLAIDCRATDDSLNIGETFGPFVAH